MAWFKVDDHLAFHPKVVAAGNAAMGLWTRAGSYCAAHLTDGCLPRAMLGPLGGRLRDAQKLIECDLWEATEEGWRFRNWNEFQPTKAQVEADRAATAERVREWRKRKGNDVGNGVTNDVSNTVGTDAPSRPVPSRPEEPIGSSPKRKPELPLPKDWMPTQAHAERAEELKIDLMDAVADFRVHAETHDRRAANWNAAFTTWLKKADEFGKNKKRPSQQASGNWLDNLETVRVDR